MRIMRPVPVDGIVILDIAGEDNIWWRRSTKARTDGAAKWVSEHCQMTKNRPAGGFRRNAVPVVTVE